MITTDGIWLGGKTMINFASYILGEKVMTTHSKTVIRDTKYAKYAIDLY